MQSRPDGDNSNIGDGNPFRQEAKPHTRPASARYGVRECVSTERGTMIYAFVLAQDGTALMPTDIRHARRMLKKHEAVIAGHDPFTIQLTRPSEHHVQPIELCCDTGSEHIGVSIKSAKHEFVHNQYDNLKDEKKHHANRLKNRRTRRNRKRYRKARFDNRKKDKGWIAPSLENKEQNHLRIIEKYKKVCPIVHATLEVGPFDTAAMKEYQETGTVLQGEAYQHGPRYGYATLREAVFYRDGYKCRCCKKGIKKGAILRIHHLGYLKGDRSNRMSNLITVCTECHTAANHKPGGKLYDWKPRVKPLKDAAFMNTVRWKLYNDVKARFPDMKVSLTYGASTKLRRRVLNIEKTHANDAYAMGEFHPVHRQHELIFVKQRRHNRILQKFHDAKYRDVRTGETKSGAALSCGRTNRSESRRSPKNLRIYRANKVKKGFVSIRTQQYKIRPNDRLFIDGKWQITSGVHNNGTRCLVNKKSIDLGKVKGVHHCGGWALLQRKEQVKTAP